MAFARMSEMPERKWRSKDTLLGYVLIVPALTIMFGLVGYPTLYAFWLSFHDKQLAVQHYNYVGVRNYAKVLGGELFWTSLWRTLAFTIVTLFLKMAVGLATALVLHDQRRWRGVTRAMVLLPWAIPPLTGVLTWRFLFSDTTNVLNHILVQAHLIKSAIPWLGVPEYAMIATVIVNVWRGFPFFAISLLAGLATVPRDLYDVAEIDGAGFMQRFWHVTLPGIMPVLIVSLVLSGIWTFNEFPGIWLLTSGGPGVATTTLPILSYLEAFVSGTRNISVAVIYSLLPLPLMLLVITLLNRSISRREEHQ